MMVLHDFIRKKISFLSLESSFSEVVDFLIAENLSHFPVVKNDVFLGNLSLNDAETFEADDKIDKSLEVLEVFYARDSFSWFEVLEISSKNQSNIIPVLNKENQYLGAYLLEDVIAFFNETPFLKESGTTIIVQKGIYNFSLSQISQIFESNNAKIFGLFVSELSDQMAQIIIKTTSVNINEIIQTLRRYEYQVISEHLEDQFLSDLKERSDYLDKYLNI